MTLPGEPSSGAAPDPGPAIPAETLETLRGGLRLMALRRLGDADLAEEAAQEALARSLAALRGDVRIEDLGAYVHGVARHVIADLLRARRRNAGSEPLANRPDPAAAADALGQAVSAEERERVRAALGRLAAADREILRLSFYEGLTPAQLAERLGEPSLRIRKRKSRALERLRRAFLGSGSGHDRDAGATDMRGRTHPPAGEPEEAP